MPFVQKSPTQLKHSLTPEISRLRRDFRASGWSYRRAAPHLGVTYQHLALVLAGHRHSKRLVAKIKTLLKNPPNRP